MTQEASKPLFDLTTPTGRDGWVGAHDVAALSSSPEGLVITSTGDDPYVHSPLAKVAIGKPLWLRLRLKATLSGMAQVFFYAPPAYATEENSVRFPVKAGRWEDVRVAIPALMGEHVHVRFDPPGTKGGVTILASLAVEPRIPLTEPTWREPVAPPALTAFEVVSGRLKVRHALGIGSFEVLWDGTGLALGYAQLLLGYQTAPDKPLQWVSWAEKATPTVIGSAIRAAAADPDGGVWTLEQRFQAEKGDRIQVVTTLLCDQPRYLAHVPALLLLLGERRQALLSGVEYLDERDTSSSEADLRGPQALRHVPDSHMLTLPLMAMQQRSGTWLALAWEKSPHCAPVFDSPNRRMGTQGGHVMGLLFPGSPRPNGSVLPHAGVLLKPGQPLVIKATLYGGVGGSVLPAVEAWLRDNPLPPVPKPKWDALTGVGWLDSGCGTRGEFRHALPGAFPPQPAADAAVLLEALGLRRREPRLRAAAAEAAARVGKGETGGVGHVHTLGPALARGGGQELIAKARTLAEQALARFAPDGTVPYVPGKVDYGATHFEKSATGLVAPVLASALEQAMLSGDKALLRAALERTRQAHERWKNTVPRGAQTWEVPLHTPDVLASAYLVKAATLAFELSGEPYFLEMASHWAWTGVPFIYLVHPNPGEEVGLYATTPVLGATGWVAPNWIGLPVQWCGLVYADALLDLARHLPSSAPWKTLAEGIVVSGVQQSFPPGSDKERQGLLPDSFNVVAQLRNDPAINPATVQVPLLRVSGTPLYSRELLAPGLLVHAPGRVAKTGPRKARVEGWPEGGYSILVTGLSEEPEEIRGKVKKVGYNNGVLVLEATATVVLEI